MQSANPVPNESPAHYGEVFDRGYARYTGPRLGRRQAVRSLIGFSMKRAMGIRKSWTAKVLPFLLYIAVIIPVIVMIGVDALITDFNFGSYTSYISWTFVVVGVFVAMSAPEMLCVDRKERTLPLYFSRAISRLDYVAAKVVAMTLLTMTMTLVPMVILWLGQQLSADSVWGAIRSNIGDLGRVIFLGALISLTLGVIGLVVSSMTDRKGVAITVIFIGFIILTAMAAVAIELLLDEYEWAKYLLLLSFSDVFVGISGHLFDDITAGSQPLIEDANLSLGVYVGYCIVVIVLGLLFLRWRYSPRDDG
jgi:ABC-2 type transport system permease protein